MALPMEVVRRPFSSLLGIAFHIIGGRSPHAHETASSARASAIGGTDAKNGWADLKLCHGGGWALVAIHNVDWVIDEAGSHPNDKRGGGEQGMTGAKI